MSANNPPSQFSSHSKGQNSLNRTGTTHSKGQNSLNRTGTTHSKGQNSLNPQAGFTPRRDTAAPSGEKTGTARKSFPLTAVLLLVIVLMAGALVYLYRNPRENAPDQTQPPVQTEALQTQPPTETAAPRPPEPVIVKTPLVALRPSAVDGTLYIYLSDGSAEDIPYTAHVDDEDVMDNFGNCYTFSIHADGPTRAERSISYQLGGKYTRFRGQIVFLAFADNIKNNKPVQIYCDGILVFSAEMSQDTKSLDFDIDLTGVQTLDIVYPESEGSNDQAAICDAWLESYENP